MDCLELKAILEVREHQEDKALPGNLDLMEHLANQELQELLELQVHKELLEHLVHQVIQGLKDLVALLEQQVTLERLERLVE
jgi:hypothetical protein